MKTLHYIGEIYVGQDNAFGKRTRSIKLRYLQLRSSVNLLRDLKKVLNDNGLGWTILRG